MEIQINEKENDHFMDTLLVPSKDYLKHSIGFYLKLKARPPVMVLYS